MINTHDIDTYAWNNDNMLTPIKHNQFHKKIQPKNAINASKNNTTDSFIF